MVFSHQEEEGVCSEYTEAISLFRIARKQAVFNANGYRRGVRIDTELDINTGEM